MSQELRVNQPSRFNMLTEGRTIFEYGAASLLMPLLKRGPDGDGHPVMVLPGFLASDTSTRLLRKFLVQKNYQPSGWGLGRNLGTHITGGDPVLSDELINQVLAQFVKDNRKVSLIGWSLGGILAREIARIVPDCVRQVITLGSPFNGPKGAAPMAAKLFQLINGDVAKKHPDIAERMVQPPPVPSTAIYSRTDGVAHWKACIDDYAHDAIQTENIEVRGSHIGLGHNPQVLWVIADRLAQAEGCWQPFRKNNVHHLLYPNPHRA